MSHHDKHTSNSSGSANSSHKFSSSSSKKSSSSNSSSSHHSDFPRLHKLKGAKWKAFIKLSPKLYDNDEEERSSKKKHSNTVMRLDRNDMHLYGLFPETDLFVAVLCEICGATIKPHGMMKHIKSRHSDTLLLTDKWAQSSNLDNLMSNQNLSELQEILSNANLINSSASSSSGSKKHSKSSTSSSSSAQKSGSSKSSSRSSYKSSTTASSTVTSQSQCSSPLTKGSVPRASSNPPDYFNNSSSSNSLDSVALAVSLKQAAANSSTTLSDLSQQLKQIQSKSPAGDAVKVESHSTATVPSKSSTSTSKKNKRKALASAAMLTSPASTAKVQPLKDREYDADRHCGVLNMDTNNPCLRSLTCKSHALSLRRSVIGRSKSFDTLLLDQKTSRDAKPLELTDSNSNLSFDAVDFVAAPPIPEEPDVKPAVKPPSESSKLLLREKIKSDPELLYTASSIVAESPAPPIFDTSAVKQETELNIDDTFPKIEDFTDTCQKQLAPVSVDCKDERLDENEIQKLVQQKVQAKHEERERQHQVVTASPILAADIIAQQFVDENPNTILTDASILMDPNRNVVQVSVSGTLKTSPEQNGLEAVNQMSQQFGPSDPLTVTVPVSMLSVMVPHAIGDGMATSAVNNTTQLHQLEDVGDFVSLDENVQATNAFATEASAWYTATGSTDDTGADNTGEFSEALYFQFDDGEAMADERNQSLSAEFERSAAAAVVNRTGEDIIYLPSEYADTNMAINPHQLLAHSGYLAATTVDGAVANDVTQNSYSILEGHQQLGQPLEMFEVDTVDPSAVTSHHVPPITFNITDTANLQLQLLTPITKPSKTDTTSSSAANCSSSDEDNICCDLKTWYTSIPKPTTINTFGLRRVGGGVTTNRKMLAFRKTIVNDKSYICSGGSGPTAPSLHRSSSGVHYNELSISSMNHKTQDFVQLTNGLQNTNSHSLFVNKTTAPANRGRRFVSLTMTKKTGGEVAGNGGAPVNRYKKLLFQDPLFQSLLKHSSDGSGRQSSSSSSNHVSGGGGGQKRDHHEMNNHDIDNNGYMQMHVKRSKMSSKSRDFMHLAASSSPPSSLMNNGNKPPGGGANNGTTLSPVHQKLPRIF